MSNMDSKKQRIRESIKEQRQNFSLSEKQHADDAIRDAVLSTPEIQASQVICIYVSLPDEVDTKGSIEALLKQGKTVIVPKVEPDNTITLHKITSLEDLSPGAFGILEPTKSTATIDPDDVDALIAPGVGFDRNKARLGRGKGYYDRLLAGISAPCIGLAYAFQILSRLPVGEYDIPMDVVITEKEIIR